MPIFSIFGVPSLKNRSMLLVTSISELYGSNKIIQSYKKTLNNNIITFLNLNDIQININTTCPNIQWFF